MTKTYTKESIKKVVKHITNDPLKMAIYLEKLDVSTRQEIVEVYLLSIMLDFIEKSERIEEIMVFQKRSHLCNQSWEVVSNHESLLVEIKKCIKDLLVEEKQDD